MSATFAARAHTNATLSAPPVRRSKPAPRKSPWLGQVWRAALRRPGRSLVLFLFGCGAFAIVLNALAFQKVRHPAPMAAVPAPVAPPARPADLRIEQASRSDLPVTAPEPVPAVVTPGGAPRPPVRPAERPQTAARETSPRPPAPVANAAPRQAPTAQAPAPAPAPRVSRDPIADLINGDMRPPGEIRGVASAKPAAPRRSAEN